MDEVIAEPIESIAFGHDHATATVFLTARLSDRTGQLTLTADQAVRVAAALLGEIGGLSDCPDLTSGEENDSPAVTG